MVRLALFFVLISIMVGCSGRPSPRPYYYSNGPYNNYAGPSGMMQGMEIGD